VQHCPVFFDAFVFANLIEFFLVEEFLEKCGIPIDGNVVVV